MLLCDPPPDAPLVIQGPRKLLHSSTLLALLILVGGCANTWEQTRAEVVNPIHELLHHAYPEAFTEQDPAELVALFSDADAATQSLSLLAGFREVEAARAEIESVQLEEDQPVRAHVKLQVHGTGRDGELRSVLQEKHFVLASNGAGWRIAVDPPTPLRIVPTPPTAFVDEAQLRGL